MYNIACTPAAGLLLCDTLNFSTLTIHISPRNVDIICFKVVRHINTIIVFQSEDLVAWLTPFLVKHTHQMSVLGLGFLYTGPTLLLWM